jgi:predicted metal-dependent hydrolase
MATETIQQNLNLTPEMKTILNGIRRKYYKDNKDKIKSINNKWIESKDNYQKNYYYQVVKKDRKDKPRIVNLTDEEKKLRHSLRTNIRSYEKRINEGKEINISTLQNFKEKLQILENKMKNQES